MGKSVYSLFGDKERGYKRFLYDPYLPRSQNAEACIFDLTAEDIKHYYDMAWDLTDEVCATLLSALGDGHRVWPVDRSLITSMMHASLYGGAAGRVFLSQHGDDINSFVARYHRPSPEQMSLVEYPLSAIDPGLAERALCAVLQAHGVQVVYESGENGQVALLPFYRKVRAVLGEVKQSVRDYLWIGKALLEDPNKSLLIYLNGFLEKEELEKFNGTVSAHRIDRWASYVSRGLRKRISEGQFRHVPSGARETWRRLLGEIGAERYGRKVDRLLPVVADLYPMSLLEERGYLLRDARRFVRLLRFRREKKRIALSMDHRIWKFEWPGALAQALVEDGSLVVGQHHGPNGHLRCNLADSTEQILRTHYASISKRPFLRLDKQSPKILPVALPRKFYPVSKRQLVETKEYSIWFFPHLVEGRTEDSINCYFSDQFLPPENYFERMESIMTAFTAIARNPRVDEIIIKPKADETESVDRFRSFMKKLILKDQSKKIRLADRGMTMPEALPLVSIAIHTIFSTGAVQTLFFGIPTIVLLGERGEIPENLRYFDQWAHSGAFVKDAEQMASVLIRWIASGYKLPEHLSQTFKEDWGGSGNPTIEEQLRRLLLL